MSWAAWFKKKANGNWNIGKHAREFTRRQERNAIKEDTRMQATGLKGELIADHDYTRRGWGHDYTFKPNNEGLKGDMSGFGHGIKPGHLVKLESGVLYRIDEIKYMSDPTDQWFAKVSFVPANNCSECKRKFSPDIKSCPACEPETENERKK